MIVYAGVAGLTDTYDRSDANEFVAALVDHLVPRYRLLAESFD